MHRDFGFAIATLKLFKNQENVKIPIFPFKLSRAEMLYLQKYLTHLQKTYLWLKDEEDSYSGWKFQLCIEILSFAIATLQLFQSPENVKISILSLYTVRAEMLFLQKYLTNFEKLFFGWKKRKMASVFENLLCTNILVWQ